jgi:hypothetical protein
VSQECPLSRSQEDTGGHQGTRRPANLSTRGHSGNRQDTGGYDIRRVRDRAPRADRGSDSQADCHSVGLWQPSVNVSGSSLSTFHLAPTSLDGGGRQKRGLQNRGGVDRGAVTRPPPRTATPVATGANWRHSAALSEFRSLFLNGLQRSVNRKVLTSPARHYLHAHAWLWEEAFDSPGRSLPSVPARPLTCPAPQTAVDNCLLGEQDSTHETTRPDPIEVPGMERFPSHSRSARTISTGRSE